MSIPSDAQARQWLRFLCRRYERVDAEANIHIEVVLARARALAENGLDEAAALFIAGAQGGRALRGMWKPITFALVAANLNERGLKLTADGDELRRVLLEVCSRRRTEADLAPGSRTPVLRRAVRKVNIMYLMRSSWASRGGGHGARLAPLSATLRGRPEMPPNPPPKTPRDIASRGPPIGMLREPDLAG